MASSILYRGPSLLDGKPIIAIATDASTNSKTGGMVHTWIMRDDIAPHEALKTGDDSSVCGDCPHRPLLGGSCYVIVFQAPLSIFKAAHRGRYEPFQAGQYAGRMVRIGSYGDPAAVPLDVWAGFVEGTAGYTGYTHQWSNPEMKALSTYCMASVDTPEEVPVARAMGFRTFRVRLESEPVLKQEVVCPASEEAGHKVQCADCKACCGTTGRRKSGIVIMVHGSKGKTNKFKTMRGV